MALDRTFSIDYPHLGAAVAIRDRGRQGSRMQFPCVNGEKAMDDQTLGFIANFVGVFVFALN
ncbi:hypothetical protein AKJ16_DCAP11653 [Drosera capensis]